ncbi:MAG TPA: F0F1 ATP synthase subunit B [Candidatus Faecousia faecavium]|nr:F0F1 ATP synthase subunit B [Candidatus Faecousia faecavium]
MELYQSLVAVNPVTLIASICNLFIQLFLFKKLFWDKILNILDQRRQAADQEISDAKAAHAEADAIKATYEENMRQAKEKADSILMNAQKTATLRSEEIIGQAQAAAAQIKSKASADIALEKKKAINDAKNEISGLAMAIAGKVVARELTTADQAGMIDRFIDELGDNV